MPITFEIDRARKTVFAQATGTITKDDFFSYQKALQAPVELRYFNECIDLSTAEDFEGATDTNMMGLARMSVQLDDPAQPTLLAIIATSDLHYGLARMYETYRSMQPNNSRKVAIFRTRDEAIRWLSGDSSAP